MSNNTIPMWRIRRHRKVIEYVDSLGKREREKILQVEEKLGVNPFDRSLNAEPLEGRQGAYRIKVGGHRILYKLDKHNREVFIFATGPRGASYGRRLKARTKRK